MQLTDDKESMHTLYNSGHSVGLNTVALLINKPETTGMVIAVKMATRK